MIYVVNTVGTRAFFNPFSGQCFHFIPPENTRNGLRIVCVGQIWFYLLLQYVANKHGYCPQNL